MNSISPSLNPATLSRHSVAARMAVARRKPYVLTHYGTEIWHHDGRDPVFRRFNRDARHVAFYTTSFTMGSSLSFWIIGALGD